MKQTQSVGYTGMSSSLWVWLVMSVRGYDCSCLCSSCEFEERLFHKVGLVSSSQVSPPCASDGLHAWPWHPPRARGQVIVPSKATAGVGDPAWGCHMSLSPLSPWQPLLRWAGALVRVGARGWGVGGWCHRSALPAIGTPRHAPPERRHSRLQRETRGMNAGCVAVQHSNTFCWVLWLFVWRGNSRFEAVLFCFCHKPLPQKLTWSWIVFHKGGINYRTAILDQHTVYRGFLFFWPLYVLLAKYCLNTGNQFVNLLFLGCIR